MKEIIKKSALIGLVGVPVILITSAISTGIVNGITKSINKRRLINK